jgi:hypothetical protein
VRLGGWRRHRQDVAGVASVVAMALAYMAPALKDGLVFGPYDAAADGTIGNLGTVRQVPLYNRLNGDVVNQAIPWNTLDWRLVHAGQLPLWNPYNVLGLPQLFNFESGAFSLPALAGYAVPLRLAFTVTVLVKLLVAGLGTYLLCRQLAVHPLPAVFGAVSFMLSGGFSSWLGWSLSGVVAFAPLVCAFMLLAYRERRPRYVVLLAVSVMFAYYGGFPEMYALLAGALVGFAAGAAATLLLTRRPLSLQGGARVLGGLALGSGLACPLLLPGAQVLRLSTHAATRGIPAGTAISRLSLLVSSGYYGLPVKGSVTFPHVNFYETVAYVGIVAIAAAAAGLVLARRQAAVVGLGLLTLVSLLASYRIGSTKLAGELFAAVGLRSVHPSRVRLVAALGISCLGAVGLDRLCYRPGRATRRAWLAAAVLAAGLVGALCWSSAVEHLRGREGTERLHALIWPVGLAAALVVAALAVALAGRASARAAAPGAMPARWRLPLGLGLTGLQGAFVLFAGVGLNSWSHTGVREYPAALELRHVVGRGIVAFDGRSGLPPTKWPQLGFYPNLNILYQVTELAGHDPVLPAAYARTWPVPPAHHGSKRPRLSALDMPEIASAAQARRYGISYLLLPPGRALPPGTSLAATVGGEQVARVEGGSRFSFAGAGGAGSRVLSWSEPSDNRWVVHVDAPSATSSRRELVLAITRLPGFSVTAGGRPLRVRPYGRFEMEVTVPEGASTVRVTYWPGAFTDGIVVAAASLLLLLAWSVLAPVLGGRRSAAHRRKPPAVALGRR